DREKFAADWVSLRIRRAKLAFAKTAHRGRSAIKKALVDRQRGRFVRTGMVERMNDSGSCAESERGLLKPTLQRRQRLIFNNSGRERFRSKRQKISNPTGAADELNFAAEGSGSDIESVVDQQTARRDQRTFAQVKR